MASVKAQNIYGGMEMINMKNLSFNFCEDPLIEKYSKLNSIDPDTFTKYMDKVVRRVEGKVSAQIPHKFILTHDGWASLSVHYFGIFAAYRDSENNVQFLLKFIGVIPIT